MRVAPAGPRVLLRRLRDPLVALRPGDPTRLLGCSWVALGRGHATTPSFFLLEREVAVAP